MRNGGESIKYQGMWLATTPFWFDSEKLRNPPLRIHSPLKEKAFANIDKRLSKIIMPQERTRAAAEGDLYQFFIENKNF